MNHEDEHEAPEDSGSADAEARGQENRSAGTDKSADEGHAASVQWTGEAESGVLTALQTAYDESLMGAALMRRFPPGTLDRSMCERLWALYEKQIPRKRHKRKKRR